MKKQIFGVLALAMFMTTSCKNENTEVIEETAHETAVNTEITPELNTQMEDTLKTEKEVAVDSLKTEQVTPAVK